ncbi:MAG TPA: DUF711 family protein [Bryobacteraceae bacterium]|nr:DUF711 family protein [Bryobacteraceae bacterium]
MRKILLTLCFAALAFAADSRPRIRAVTVFIDVDSTNYAAKIQDAQKFLAVAKTAFNRAGFEGAGGRITTQPFPVYTHGLARQEALGLIRKMREAASKGSSALDIGPAMMHDNDDLAPVALLTDVLSANLGVNANLVIADEQGIHWRAVNEAAKLIKAVSQRSPHGDGNFSFGAIAMVKPYGPYYPGSYHLGQGHAFAVAMEGAGVVGDVFEHYRDPVEAERQLSKTINEYAKRAEAVALQLASSTKWTYEGIDATPAPLGDRSIAGAIESFTGAPFGANGTLTASRIITHAVQSTTVKRIGYSGLMIPVLEDNLMAQRWAEGTFNLDSMLAYSAVCAAGLDTVPLPGDVTEEQIGRILGDLASLAYKWDKPLAARLLPAPGKKPGDKTAFSESEFLKNTVVQPLPGARRP